MYVTYNWCYRNLGQFTRKKEFANLLLTFIGDLMLAWKQMIDILDIFLNKTNIGFDLADDYLLFWQNICLLLMLTADSNNITIC